MKTLGIGLLALLTVVSAGCGKAREAQMAAENAPTANVAGTWTGSAGTGGVFAPVSLTLAQNGTDLSGNITVGGRSDLNGAVKGTVKGETVNLTLPTVKLGQLLVKQQNYFSDPDSGYRHGNFYICGPGVRFEDLTAHNTHPVCILYLSLDVSPVDSTSDDWLLCPKLT